ncbi:MAG: acyl-CoA reductase-like NAD-dependent aldehyde dehydrogenase, partial [Myxococcota bacterium]
MNYYDTHHERLSKACDTIRTRGYWSPFQESPSRRFHPEGARLAGQQAFEARLGTPFDLGLDASLLASGALATPDEISPYTGDPLGISYPHIDVDQSMAAMAVAMRKWARALPKERVGLCLEMLDRWHNQTFENAYATMHTAGQGFMMAFAGSGANSLDRGLEGLAIAHQAMNAIPTTAIFERSFGRAEPARLHKRYRLHPRGIAIVITCGSYPAWNAYPAIMANLATGNPVVVKPHPGAILPMAIAVETGRA